MSASNTEADDTPIYYTAEGAVVRTGYRVYNRELGCPGTIGPDCGDGRFMFVPADDQAALVADGPAVSIISRATTRVAAGRAAPATRVPQAGPAAAALPRAGSRPQRRFSPNAPGLLDVIGSWISLPWRFMNVVLWVFGILFVGGLLILVPLAMLGLI